MKYVLMFVDTEQFAADLAAMGEGERERAYARVREWLRRACLGPEAPRRLFRRPVRHR